MKTTVMVVALLVGASGCGGGGGGATGAAGGGGATGAAGGGGATGAAGGVGTCGKVQPCGGAVVGTWTVASICILDNALFSADIAQLCATATLEATSARAVGTQTYGADLTFQATGSATLDLKLTLPLSCFAPGKTCAGLQTTYQQDPSFQSASCAVTGSACICALVSVQDATDSGTYSTSGTTLSSISADGSTNSDPYCVQGNELHSIGVDMSMPMGPMGQAHIQGDLVFRKQ